MKYAIVNINLQLEIPDDLTDEQAEKFAINYELPKEYVNESYEFIKIVEE